MDTPNQNNNTQGTDNNNTITLHLKYKDGHTETIELSGGASNDWSNLQVGDKVLIGTTDNNSSEANTNS